MNAKDLYQSLVENFPHQPTLKQELVLRELASFIMDDTEQKVFLLKGYAGTGKTSLLGVLVNQLWKVMRKSVLLAPTGRAAKVLSGYSGKPAFTIHRHIYFPKKEKGGGVKFVLAPNKHKDTVFIVDEASMISDAPAETGSLGGSSLLDDLFSYVYSGVRCRLILIGDTAQLPPVNRSLSPALDAEVLELGYHKPVIEMELDEVVRQDQDSGILENATLIREQLMLEHPEGFRFQLGGFKDIVRLTDGYEIQDAINDAYSQGGLQETAIVVRSNKRANLYNQNIRNRILFLEQQLSSGDQLMVVKNNYFWLKSDSDAGFIANGDLIEILEIFGYKSLYGFEFAEVKVQMTDYPSMAPFETVLLLDTLTSETPALSYEQQQQLYEEVMKDYEHETSGYRKFMQIKNNRYFNALQVKFSYAVTCHKSQGGQWETVFVEQPFMPGEIDREYLRWLYTALTRARSKVYLLGFRDNFFAD